MHVQKLIQLKFMLNKLDTIVLTLEQVLKQLLLIFANQVIKANFILFFFYFSFALLGEEKPQPYIPLDIDRQVEGKLVTSNHVSVSPPNGRLPMSASYLPNNSNLLPSHISQSHPNTTTSSPLLLSLDGGVYQGHSQTQPNTKVNFFFFWKEFLLKQKTN